MALEKVDPKIRGFALARNVIKEARRLPDKIECGHNQDIILVCDCCLEAAILEALKRTDGRPDWRPS